MRELSLNFKLNRNNWKPSRNFILSFRLGYFQGFFCVEPTVNKAETNK